MGNLKMKILAGDCKFPSAHLLKMK